MEGETEDEQTRGQTKNKQSGKRQQDKGRKGEEDRRKKMRQLLESFVIDISEGVEVEETHTPSIGEKRAEESRKRR